MSKLASNNALDSFLNFIKMTRRRLRLVKINRNLLVYLIFFFISLGFWCLQTLKETSSQSIDFQLEITGVPKNVIFTSDLPSVIKVTAEGRGFDFLEHYTHTKSNVISISFESIKRKDGKAATDANTLRRMAQKQLGNALTVQSCSPSSLELFYSTGKKKRVPVYFGGKATTGMQHVLCDIIVQPDSVDIYAPKRLCDSINAIYTERVYYKNVEDTLVRTLALTPIQGVKMMPKEVEVKICVDLFTEKEIAVPIYCENIPANKILRTFPIKANISFHVSANMFNKITEKDFLLVVDYNSVKNGDDKCQIILRNQPEGITHVQVSPEYVEYVIEEAD